MDLDQTIEQYLPIAKKLSAEYYFWSDQHEIWSTVLQGLLEAVEGYNPSKGAALHTHIKNTIRFRLKDLMRSYFGRKDVLDKDGFPSGYIKKGRNIIFVPLDFQATPDCEPLANIIKDERAVCPSVEQDLKDVKILFDKYLKTSNLTKQEQEVIIKYYFNDEKDDEIAKQLMVTGSRINQIRKKALKKLKVKFETVNN